MSFVVTWTLAQKELGDALRNRWFLLYTIAFTGLSLALSYMSLAGAGIAGFAGFGRTAASLINLVLLIIPLMALTVGAQSLAHEQEQGTLAYLLAQPVTRVEVFTGKYLGLVHIQRMLRESPGSPLGTLIDKAVEPLSPTDPLSVVARRLATYNLVSMPVTDAAGRLVGAVTVDDVLDHLLPEDWRESDDRADDLHTPAVPAPGGKGGAR